MVMLPLSGFTSTHLQALTKLTMNLIWGSTSFSNFTPYLMRDWRSNLSRGIGAVGGRKVWESTSATGLRQSLIFNLIFGLMLFLSAAFLVGSRVLFRFAPVSFERKKIGSERALLAKTAGEERH